MCELHFCSSTSEENALNVCPDRTVRRLQSIMKLMRLHRQKSWKVNLPNISIRSFETIGTGRWLDDEVINYFVTKWCSKSQTALGLNTFFACKFLFEGSSCISANSVEHLTSEHESRVQKWCLAAKKAQNLSSWESVFIPINESNSHWYSACINFRLQRVEIYDSLREVYLKSRENPVPLRKNTKTMLVLMWLTEILGRMRGEEVWLRNNPYTTWQFDPHAKVPFQSNNFDCGVHTLWHPNMSLSWECLDFGGDMSGKRLRLAQEMLEDTQHGRLNIPVPPSSGKIQLYSSAPSRSQSRRRTRNQTPHSFTTTGNDSDAAALSRRRRRQRGEASTANAGGYESKKISEDDETKQDDGKDSEDTS
ncbi:hypothetical protein DFH05DRAFT_1570329 [Lentinula detonsa]|uniref:Ubiquitin-like protease family profile domain-containing protein n=1 Tax=Lentinula detonsa TaxID=2804962 RepID=A0A9W8U450_9AGAR|nr:hypothetical protein DFH05DRAFT_1570329 [Lentinula detonsa]